MTIVAAYIDSDGNTAIGCDTCSEDETVRIDVDTKLVRIGDAIVGAAGLALWRRFLEEYAAPLVDVNDVLALADAWIDWAVQRKHGQDFNGAHGQAGSLLVALHGHLLLVDGTGTVIPITEGYAAIGSGQAVGMGALAVVDDDCETAVSKAVGAAIRHAPGCGGQCLVWRAVPAAVQAA